MNVVHLSNSITLKFRMNWLKSEWSGFTYEIRYELRV